jgi:catechol 2,3-dioxygenase-like lactoylglutathione lyase family enzyme
MTIPFNCATGTFVAISVQDLDSSTSWYAEKLGLSVLKQATAKDKSAAVAVLQGGGFTVELVWFASALPLSKITSELKGNHEVYGMFKSGLCVRDLDSTYEQLKSRGVTMAFEPFFDPSMQCRMFAIRDNGGNILQFFGT